MKSPFPGMDPYLERHWGDVHTRLTTYISDALQDNLPEGLVAQVEESVQVGQAGDGKWMKPDVSVTEQEDHGPQFSVMDGSVSVAEPIVIAAEEETERWIEIIDLDTGNRLVTAIEILSPSNKSGYEGRANYIGRQKRYLQSQANLIEIDLLRGGDHIVAAPARIIGDRLSDYIICVSRYPDAAGDFKTWEVYPVSLHEPLPNFRIPLRPSDADVVLQLQPILDKAYRNGRYDRKIDYSRPLDPPLKDDDADWAKTLIEQQAS